MKATTEQLQAWVVAGAHRRDLATQPHDVETSGQHGTPPVSRSMALAANGFSRPPERADPALIFGLLPAVQHPVSPARTRLAVRETGHRAYLA